MVVNQNCVGCCCCMSACPKDAIKVVEGKAYIDSEKCIECQACKNVCPMQAIEQKL